MDTEVFNLVQEQLPKFNRKLAEGYALSQCESNEIFIDKVWRQVELSFPPNLKYLGFRRPTPAEEFRVVSNFGKQNKRIYDVARSDVYLVQFLFSLNGEEVKDVLYIRLEIHLSMFHIKIKKNLLVISKQYIILLMNVRDMKECRKLHRNGIKNILDRKSVV